VSLIDCPACGKPTTLECGDWSIGGDAYTCSHCGAKWTVDLDSYFDGESSYPVIELVPYVEPPPPRPPALPWAQRVCCTCKKPIASDGECGGYCASCAGGAK
jgi:hypothetical protein